ncbi:hypothetical protein [Micromonospora sicca]|nr:hypothetical protein [Micromonospora sp. 4G51]
MMRHFCDAVVACRAARALSTRVPVDPDGSIRLAARAWAVGGTAPA